MYHCALGFWVAVYPELLELGKDISYQSFLAGVALSSKVATVVPYLLVDPRFHAKSRLLSSGSGRSLR